MPNRLCVLLQGQCSGTDGIPDRTGPEWPLVPALDINEEEPVAAVGGEPGSELLVREQAPSGQRCGHRVTRRLIDALCNNTRRCLHDIKVAVRAKFCLVIMEQGILVVHFVNAPEDASYTHLDADRLMAVCREIPPRGLD